MSVLSRPCDRIWTGTVRGYSPLPLPLGYTGIDLNVSYQFRSCDRIWTGTEWVYKPLPLPLGYTGIGQTVSNQFLQNLLMSGVEPLSFRPQRNILPLKYMSVPSSGIEPLSPDFQSGALPLSYEGRELIRWIHCSLSVRWRLLCLSSEWEYWHLFKCVWVVIIIYCLCKSNTCTKAVIEKAQNRRNYTSHLYLTTMYYQQGMATIQ